MVRAVKQTRRDRLRRHLSEQYFTSSQHFAHFLRQVKGLPQTGQILVARSDFMR
jgi:hypothetical protein